MFVLKNKMKKIFAGRGLWISFLAGLTAIFLVTVVGLVFDMEELVGGLVLVAVGVALKKRVKEYLLGSGEKGVAFYYTRAAYAVAGIFLGLAALSWAFNIVYHGDWFDFSDLGLAFLAMPVVYVFKFEIDNDRLVSRLLLYGIVVLNFFVITYGVDLIGYLLDKLIFNIKKINK
jgi:hypothetical protein